MELALSGRQLSRLKIKMLRKNKREELGKKKEIKYITDYISFVDRVTSSFFK